MFALHERLAGDTVLITDWPLCRVALMDDATYPWLVLIPRRHGVTEIHELDQNDRATLIEEVATASRLLHQHCRADKINVAALGNVVPQLHVHLIARFVTDPAWPKPIWGVVPTRRFGEAERDARLAELRALLERA